VRVDFSDRVRAAVVYRGEFQLGLDLSARLRGDISRLTTALYELETHSVNNFLPRQIVVGGSVDIRPWWTANLDLTWLEWSAYVAPVATLDVNLDIPPPQGGWPATITPPETPGPIRLQPLRLSNRIVPRVGTEVLVVQRPSLDVAVRGGYEWAKTPIEPQTASVTYLDLDRHTISGGAGVAARSLLAEIPGEIRLDVHGQLSVMPEETTLKARPSDFTGDYRASGHIWNLGTTVTFTLDGAPRREAP
jgi:long-chain fatty acid transport protein